MGIKLILPLIIAVLAFLALVKKIDIVGAFVEGAKEGLRAMTGILPVLMLMLTAIGVFRASGGMDILVWLLSSPAAAVGIPPEVLPVAVVKPFSGSGAIAVLDDVIKNFGVDSYIGRLASVIAASTETTFYSLSVYVGSLTKKCGRVMLCAVLADIFSFIVAAAVTKIL